MSGDLPLAGVRALDFSRNVAGPFATMILGELGADVVKIEPREVGDDARQWGPPFWGGEAPTFLALNRNKRSVTLDLKESSARPVLDRLAAVCDIVVESARPGVMDRLGYGYGWARAANAGVIYCSITAFGDRGPLRDRPGYDPLMQAYAGLMSMTGDPEGPPMRSGTSLVDMGTGMWAVIAIMAALAQRRASGAGQRIVTSLYETALMWMTYHLATYWASGTAPRRVGSGATMIAPYEAFATRDGSLVIAAGNDRLFARCCEVLGHAAWATDERFRRNPDRVRNRDALHTLLEERTRAWATRDLAAALDRAGVPASAIQSADEVARDPQALALGIFQTVAHPTIPTLLSVGLPFLLDGERLPPRRHPPRHGEHTREVLAELGFGAQDIEAFVRPPAGTRPAHAGPEDIPG
jgi:crotonobetainyl-CoA:carnitine CoA-transferase CaiB-like acyl-CoA transferase